MGGGCGNCFHPIRAIKNAVSKAIDKVDSWLTGTKKHSSHFEYEESYDPTKAQLESTMRINNALTEFRLDVEMTSDDVERDVIRLSRESLDEFVEQLREYNKITYGERRLNINLNALERDNRRTEDEVHGYIKKRVLKRVSLDDSECLEILKMDKGEEKRRKMDAFFQKILRDAINELCDMLRKNMTTQSENVADRIQSRIDDIVRSVTEKSKKFKEVEKMKQSNEKGLEQQQAEFAYLVSVCEYGLYLCNTVLT